MPLLRSCCHCTVRSVKVLLGVCMVDNLRTSLVSSVWSAGPARAPVGHLRPAEGGGGAGESGPDGGRLAGGPHRSAP